MKIFKTIVLGLFLLYLQIIFASKFAILQVIPNFLLAFIIYINLEFDNHKTFPMAFLFGLALDLVQPLLLGMNTFSFLVISLIVSNFHHSVNKKRLVVVFMSILLINITYYGFYMLFYLVTQQIFLQMGWLVLFAIIYNSLITFILSYLFQISKRIHILIDV